MLATITPPEALQGLPEDQANTAIRAAQKDGLFAGLTSALIGSMIATRLRLPRNQAILSAVATGVGAGYFFTQGFVVANLSKLRAEIAAARVQEESTNGEFVSNDA
ncbi:hypothetical protein PENSPDRAFT_1558 [Peniophora sp. CONT]|nr:hypothetical protein PENSPDRAFT_1558 [Peniophora sp. CONT]